LPHPSPQPPYRRSPTTMVRTRSSVTAEPSFTVNHRQHRFFAPQAIDLSDDTPSSFSSYGTTHSPMISPTPTKPSSNTPHASLTPSPNPDEATTPPDTTASSSSHNVSNAAPSSPLQAEHPLLALPPPSPLVTRATTPPLRVAPEPSHHRPHRDRTTQASAQPTSTHVGTYSNTNTDTSDHAASSASAESRHDQQPLPTRGRTYRSHTSVLPPECHLNGNLQFDTTTS
ncbi:hypothetical protein V6Z11_A07G133500, partial [Gossypium hirsutum]